MPWASEMFGGTLALGSQILLRDGQSDVVSREEKRETQEKTKFILCSQVPETEGRCFTQSHMGKTPEWSGDKETR